MMQSEEILGWKEDVEVIIELFEMLCTYKLSEYDYTMSLTYSINFQVKNLEYLWVKNSRII